MSAWELTDTYSPAAIDIAPVTRPAVPATRTSFCRAAEAATPVMRLAVAHGEGSLGFLAHRRPVAGCGLMKAAQPASEQTKRCCVLLVVVLPRRHDMSLAADVVKDLTVRLIDPAESRGSVEPDSLEMEQKSLDHLMAGAARSPHRVADSDNGSSILRTSAQDLLSHEEHSRAPTHRDSGRTKA